MAASDKDLFAIPGIDAACHNPGSSPSPVLIDFESLGAYGTVGLVHIPSYRDLFVDMAGQNSAVKIFLTTTIILYLLNSG